VGDEERKKEDVDEADEADEEQRREEGESGTVQRRTKSGRAQSPTMSHLPGT
jgi:hypothetical protein